MNWNIIITAITILVRIKTLEAKVKSLPLLSDDLQVLLNSLYDSGYLPEYLQEELSESEKSNGDYLEFPDFNYSQGNAESPNHPQWMSYQKEMFVPPESEYKNIIAHRNDKTHQKLAPFIGNPSNTLWDQFWKRPFLDPQEFRAELLASLTDNFNSNITGRVNNSMDFLLPIPEKGHLPKPPSAKPLLASIPSEQSIPKLNEQNPMTASYNIFPKNTSGNIPQQLVLNMKQKKSPENPSNIIVSPQALINSNESHSQTLQVVNYQTQSPKTGNAKVSNNIQSQQNSFKNEKINKMQEVQVAENTRVQNAEVAQNVKEANESPKKNNTNKKKIFSFLNVFKKGSKHSELNSLNNHSSLASQESIRKDKPTTLQELYNELIEARNLYEKNNMLQSKNEETIDLLSKINPENEINQQEIERLEELYPNDLLGRSISSEEKVKMP